MPSPLPAHALHVRGRDAQETLLRTHERRASLLSMALLATFFLGVGAAAAAWLEHAPRWLAGFAAAAVAFVVLRIFQSMAFAARDRARTTRDVHTRHLDRLEGRWRTLEIPKVDLPSDHPYAQDLDLTGRAGLLQRLDVTRTTEGLRTLTAWLTSPADRATIEARQAAVRELAEDVAFRVALESEARRTSDARLDGDRFLAFIDRPGIIDRQPWLAIAMFVLPLATLATAVLAPPKWWLAPYALVLAVLFSTRRHVSETLELVSARRGFVEAYAGMLRLVETKAFESACLQSLKGALLRDGKAPSSTLGRLETWANLADLRHDAMFSFLANVTVLWDLQCVRGLERWRRVHGQDVKVYFQKLGELEALASLATLAATDPGVTFPTIVDASAGITARGLAHPLLDPDKRVANDLRLGGPSHVLVITGSNMAGKSTLLRSLGLDAVLAFAGGPVCAESLSLPLLRIRASIGAEDALAEGASYFFAELQKLKRVIADAEQQPPILFLLDELLRGTNARARHLGARAIVKHLLERGAMGLVATHDIALSELEQESPETAKNAHFTDVVVDGEMRFDYTLRPGVVRTSNALRLLRLAGIDVPPDDALEGTVEPIISQ